MAWTAWRRKGFRPPQGGGGQQANQDQGAPARVELRGAFEPAAEPEISDKRPSVPFALPGESLSKYGGQAPPRTSAPVAQAPKANVILTKPSTLIETPIEWNGDGLLPGESIPAIAVLRLRTPLLPIMKRKRQTRCPQQEAAQSSSRNTLVSKLRFMKKSPSSNRLFLKP